MIGLKETAEKHPCFDIKARLKYARIHLPVAPKCNVQCNYCNRKYDCVNESRPGVTSAVLSPAQALNYLRTISQRITNIATIGIAGPGDAFAEPQKTIETIRLIKQEFPDKIFCLSSNGLDIEPFIDDLAELDVTHVTLTINSLRVETLEKIYSWVRFRKKLYRGRAGAEVMHQQQMKSLKALCDKGIKVKVNTIFIPGVNDTEVAGVAKEVAGMGATTFNCLPLIPAEGSKMENVPKPERSAISETVKEVSKYIKPMTHCARCRADAAGMLGKDDKNAYAEIHQCSKLPAAISGPNKPHVAIASYEGLMINQHLGEARSFHIFRESSDDYHLVEKREAPSKGTGDLRWIELGKALDDCSYVLVNGVGKRPVEILAQLGISVVEMAGLIQDGLDAVYKGKKLKSVLKTTLSKCGEGCSGNGGGCG